MKCKQAGGYVPEVDFVYPSNPDQHMIDLKIVREEKIDEHYPFLDRSFTFRFMRGLVYLGIYSACMFLSLLRLGLKIEGRDILRKHRKLLKNGAMTVSNHIHLWDTVFLIQAIRYRPIFFPVWKKLLNSPDRGFVRFTGGIPIPDEIHLLKYFNRAFDEIRAKKRWIHIFPEGSMFYFYQPIRPFKKGGFSMARRYNLPVIPVAFSYRKPVFPFTLVNRFRSLIGNRKLPMVTLRIGEPILLDKNLPGREAVEKMRNECHEAVVRLANK
jgi:1-acyl-sn-glycerol-3-phosphate acyltransferase